MITAFIEGLILSFGLVIPLGSQNVFIFNQSMIQDKYRHVLPMVFVTCLCDALLILFAALGIELFLHLNWTKPFILGFGVLFLTYVGTKVWQSTSELTANPLTARLTFLKQIVFAISVSLLNPHAIMDLFVIIGSASVEYVGAEKHAFITGCILVDFLWFFFLSMGGFHLKKIKHAQTISFYINKVSAIIMWGIAVILANQLFNTLNLRVL